MSGKNICERCVFEYIKNDMCYKGHEQYNLSYKIKECSDFEEKREIIFKILDKLCKNREHYYEEIFDGIFQCKRCFKVIKRSDKYG